MKITIPCIIVASVVIISCSQSQKKAPVIALNQKLSPVTSGQTDSICYILCDMSASQGETSRQIIMRNAQTIFNKARGYAFKYYDISAAPYEPPFFEYISQSIPKISSPATRKTIEKDFSVQCDSLNTRLVRLYKRPSANSTCIIRTIEKVVNTLTSEGPDNVDKKIKIVILSDMLEDCTYSCGRIDIDHGDFKNAMSLLARMSAPRFTLSQYKNLEVSIVASSQRIINTNALNAFWVEVFRKYGYNLNKPIVPDFPEWVVN